MLVAACIHSCFGHGHKQSVIQRLAIFDTANGMLLAGPGIILGLIGIVLVFMSNWIAGIICIIGYWIILELLINPMVKGIFLGIIVKTKPESMLTENKTLVCPRNA